ncbi:DNA repair protein RecN [Qipengyuania flava]|uniref:DNA repair protein RecN n=1 Tax=Qipengyuania flava TaxID=192812 RepID=UPI001C580DE5|nr:DNA repair protein RecN [Qipengyuania flava]MBW3168588.1 DNA repair protein RecN [Qipengyuania flava]MBY5965826.1 DNA repair protein RecN [Qipengyuania flava]MBY6012150.1 DNA repair protein RecN [Qipengyuania flava]MBY6026592.1 DNA repair protein RecN [Qipengyuania flava]
MLTRLSIRNIVLIEALDLTFGRGLGVLTGETGAGKSILLDALGLVLGNRADSGLVRGGEDKASVTASFEFAALPHALAERLDDADIEIEDGEPLIVRRQLRADGKSKAFVNDQPVSVGLLREIAGFLVELHGQHDDRGLVNPRGHRALLDRFAGVDGAKLAAAWTGWRRAEDALAEARLAVETAKADQDLLLAHLAELAALEPQAGEEARLAETRADMQKGEKLSGDLEELRHLWEGSDSPLASLRVAARRLDRIAPEHPLLAEALAALDRAVIEAGEAEDKLEAAAEALVHDPAALEAAETRLFELRALARKHRCEVDELPELMRDMRSRLESIEGSEAQLDALEAAAKDAGARYRKEAEALHDARLAAAARLDKAVAGELAPLKLDAARFRTAVTQLPEERWGAAGMDAVEFLIATNPGADFAPLAKIASGGELSRFILALKVALAEQGGAATVIFDEIDRGVGGAVASAIGERLARLSADGQLLAVTHSPQVAARGRTHYMIAKSSQGTVTKTGVVLLDEAGRQEEIARMLSGAEVTPEARAQADRLLEGA